MAGPLIASATVVGAAGRRDDRTGRHPLTGLDEVLATVDDASDLVDRGGDLLPAIELLGRHGLLALGVDRHGTLADQAVVLAALAERCMASAFAVWAHRMTIEYLDAVEAPAAVELGSRLRSATVLGSTAMADAFRDLAGISPLPLTYRRVPGGGLVVDGTVAWASNLRPGALIVTAARDADVPIAEIPTDGAAEQAERRIIAVTVGQPGLSVRPATELLALDATASGTLSFDGVEVLDDHVLSHDVTRFLRRVRPTFLTLQSAFCLGLARAALAAAPAPRGVGETFADELRATRAQLATAWEALLDLAATARDPGPLQPYLRARLDAARLARTATHLELCLTGGRGYSHGSATARRLREAAFLPVQSPTEGQLRWELSRSA